MVMSDPLSRAYVDEPPNQTKFCNDLEEIVLMDDLPISQARLKDIKEATAYDNDLQILTTTVLEGWPSTGRQAVFSLSRRHHCPKWFAVQE